MYLKKETDTYTSAYDWVQIALNKSATKYNPTMTKAYDPIIEGKWKVTRDTRVVLVVVEQKEDEIKWAHDTKISTDTG